ncbi:hypothetical protein AAC387_Pa03g1171 [Persea americana]
MEIGDKDPNNLEDPSSLRISSLEEEEEEVEPEEDDYEDDDDEEEEDDEDEVLPQLLYYFGVKNDMDSLDWATIVAYTCMASCEASWIYHGEPIVQPDDSDESEDESKENQAKSKKVQESRAKLPYNHTSGSRSFASRMSLMTTQNAGQAPSITQFFHDAHYRQKSNEWVNEVAQQRHEALVQRTEEQSQPSVTTPMTEEQIAADVLGKRSRYIMMRLFD